MLRNITIGQYIPGESIVHRLDPRTKIINIFILVILLFFVRYFISYLFFLFIFFIPVVIAKLPIKYIIKGLKPLFFIIILTFIINVFVLKEGDVIFTLGPLIATTGGLRQGAFMAIRLILLVIGTSLLTLTTSPISLTDGIERLLNPFKRIGVPAHELAMMMTIALRFIPTLMEEADKIMKAQMARGADFESGNVFNRAKSLVPLLVPLFISAFRRADDLAMAMEARCYRGDEKRTRLKELKYELKDLAAFGTILTLLAITFYVPNIIPY